MAFDTQGKRFSVLNMVSATGTVPLLVPVGSITAPDRAHLLGLLNAVDLAAPMYMGITIYATGYVRSWSATGVVPPFSFAGVV